VGDPGTDRLAKLELVATVDDYVFGFVFRTGEVAASFAGTAHEEVIAQLLPHFEAQLHSGEYPQIEALFGGGDTRESWELIVETMTDPSRFEKGLGQLLDGIEAQLAAE
jgi:hypothetical protein